MRAIHHWIDGKLTPGTSGRTADLAVTLAAEHRARVDLQTRLRDELDPDRLLGNDYLGQDVLSRVLFGGRSVLLISLLATIVGVGLGVVAGV